MSIKELKKTTDTLLEKGRSAEIKVTDYERDVRSARSSLFDAQRELEEASQEDEDGESRGDVASARRQVEYARLELELSQRSLQRAKQELAKINSDKQKNVGRIDKYNSGQAQNLAKLEQLKAMRFGSNSNAYISNLTDRMNQAEDAKDELLQSMGLSGQKKTYSSNAAGGYGNGAPKSNKSGTFGGQSVGASGMSGPIPKQNFSQASSSIYPTSGNYNSNSTNQILQTPLTATQTQAKDIISGKVNNAQKSVQTTKIGFNPKNAIKLANKKALEYVVKDVSKKVGIDIPISALKVASHSALSKYHQLKGNKDKYNFHGVKANEASNDFRNMTDNIHNPAYAVSEKIIETASLVRSIFTREVVDNKSNIESATNDNSRIGDPNAASESGNDVSTSVTFNETSGSEDNAN